MKTEIIDKTGTWTKVMNVCRSTVGKEDKTVEPSQWFKRKLLISEHSPIRELTYTWRWAGIKSWIATHFVRHKWECYVTTQRSDRTGIERDKLTQDNQVNFVGSANVQHLIDTSRKRLCKMSAPETREYWEDLKKAIKEEDREIALVMVPNCVYRCGCPERNGCGLFKDFSDLLLKETALNIEDRYKAYAYYEERLHDRRKNDRIYD